VTSSHTWSDLSDQEALTRATASIAELGSPRMIVSPSGFGSMDELAAVIDALEAAADIAGDHGLRLGVHNHSAEMLPLDGVPVIDRLAAVLGDAVDF
jgi:sugar phosphate isomerase/epimerase